MTGFARVMELEAEDREERRLARNKILDEALEQIQAIRHRIAATFAPEFSGQRGQDKTDALHEAYQAVAKLKDGDTMECPGCSSTGKVADGSDCEECWGRGRVSL